MPSSSAPPHVERLSEAEARQLSERLAKVTSAIAAAAVRAGRQPGEVTLVAVTKTVPAAAISQAALLGVRHFGENYVQESASKRPSLVADVFEQVRWHLIGHLQTNKVKVALDLFDIIQAVDSLRLAEAISRRAGAEPVAMLLEVKFGDEPTRLGFRPEEVENVVPALLRLPGLLVQGLMTVPPLALGPGGARRVFERLRELRDRLVARYPEAPLQHLSMGMTDDYEAAIQEGATIVRIGRAIFGERPAHVTGR